MITMNKFGKTIFVALLLIMGIGYAGFAQRNNLREQNLNGTAPANNAVQTRKLQRIHENFIVSQLELSPDLASRFLALYRGWQREMAEIRRLKRLNNSSTQSGGRAQLDRDLSYDRKLIDIKEHYQNEFLKILPPEKVSKMYKSEQEFKDEIFKNLTERQNN